jgi:hypothetical protein
MCSSNPSARRVGHSLGRPDLVLVTLERDHPETAFAELGKRTDPFTMWFKRQVSEIHVHGPRRASAQPDATADD